MTYTHGVARDQLRAFIERIERLEEEKKTIADDIKDVKAEAKGCGFDIGIINLVLKLRKKDADERAEQEAILDTYLIALGMLPEPFEAEEQFDPITGEFISDDAPSASDAAPLTSSQAAAGDDTLHVVPTPYGRPATPAASGGEPSKPSPDDGGAKMDGLDPHPGRSGVTPAFNHAKSGQATKHPALILRPHCQKPGQESCAGYGYNHCADCKVAMREAEKELA